ncbi:MAG: response regulator [Acidobacteria bacterium]|nr:response regulator [Acidobacteriota bacterium]
MQLRQQFRRWRVLRAQVKVWALAGLLVLNAAMYVAGRQFEFRLAQGQFDKAAAQIEQTVIQAFERSGRQLATLEDYWKLNGAPSRVQFQILTHRMLQNSSYYHGIGWISRFELPQRRQWETQASQELGRPVDLVDLNGKPVPQEMRTYYPLQYSEPASEQERILGFDLSTDPERRLALEKAVSLRRLVATVPSRRPAVLTGQPALLFLQPLMRNGTPRSLVVVALDPKRLVDSATQGKVLDGVSIVVSDADSQKELTRFNGSQEPLTQMRSTRSWRFGERNWRLDIQAHDDFIARRRSWLPIIGFCAGIGLAIAMGLHLWSTAHAIAEARRRAKRHNRRLRKLNKELSAEVQERRQAEVRLSDYSQQLEQATLLAESSAQAKTNFLAMVSHEIRTPMHAIIGMTNLLLDSPLNPDQRESAGIVLRSADSLLQIINDILDYSKIEAGKFEVEDVPFDLQQTLSEVMDAVSVRSGQKGISLMVGYPNDAPVRFLGDGGAIRQVLLNLAGNAVKFTEHGQIAVDVLVLEEDEDLARMYISVSDTGIGIPEDRLHRLFHPFQQADSSMRRKFGGTGLGLAISKRLTELMGGTITADSQVGVGTIFQLDLPLKKDRSAQSGDYCPIDLHNVEVLVAEPNPAIAGILGKQLDSCHVLHREVGSIPEMVEELSREETDYRIFLIGGDDAEGWDPGALTALIRKRQRPAPHVLVRIAPYSIAGERAAMEEAGFSAYLVMPVFASVLMNALGQAWGAAKQGIIPKPILTRQSMRDVAAMGSMAEPLSSLCHVLLVEDNAVNQKIGQRLLEKLNCKVEIAVNGLAAIRKWSTESYDVILMDCQMPEMDGFEATAEIRRRESQLHCLRTPIIAMTANNMQGDREQCLESGMDDFLPKPVSFNELREKLERALQNRPPTSAIQPQSVSADEKGGVTVF